MKLSNLHLFLIGFACFGFSFDESVSQGMNPQGEPVAICSTLVAEGAPSPRLMPEYPEDILTLPAVAHPDLMNRWREKMGFGLIGTKHSDQYTTVDLTWPKIRDSSIAIANFIHAYFPPEIYPKIIFLMRDPGLVGYAMKLLEPNLDRVKFLFVSRVSINDPLISEYLKQEELDEASLLALAERKQRKLIVDSGFKMSLGKAIIDPMGRAAQNAVDFLLFTSFDKFNFPSLNLTSFAAKESSQSSGEIVNALAQAPKATGRTLTYETVAGVNGSIQIRPVVDPGNTKASDLSDKIISLVEWRLILEDLKAAVQKFESEGLNTAIQRPIIELNLAATRQDKVELKKIATRFLADGGHGSLTLLQAKQILADWLVMYKANPINRDQIMKLSRSNIGLSKNDTQLLYDLGNDALVFKLHPEWQDGSKNNEYTRAADAFAKAFQQRDYGIIKQMLQIIDVLGLNERVVALLNQQQKAFPNDAVILDEIAAMISAQEQE